MGKTRTAVIAEIPDDKSSGKAKYAEKKKKAAEKRAAEEKKKKQIGKVGLKGGERIKVVGGEMLEKEESSAAEAKDKKKKAELPRKRGEKYIKARGKVDNKKFYPLTEAIKLVKETSYSSFDGTVELHLVVKKENQSFNLELPHSSGKKKKIEIANSETLKKLKSGKVDFDILLATAEMMPRLVPFAKILGPKGLMPNPKTGTLIKDKKEVKNFSGNSITIKTERKAPIIHVSIGKVSQKEKDLKENTQAVVDKITTRQIEKAYLTSTMGPSVRLDVNYLDKPSKRGSTGPEETELPRRKITKTAIPK